MIERWENIPRNLRLESRSFEYYWSQLDHNQPLIDNRTQSGKCEEHMPMKNLRHRRSVESPTRLDIRPRMVHLRTHCFQRLPQQEQEILFMPCVFE